MLDKSPPFKKTAWIEICLWQSGLILLLLVGLGAFAQAELVRSTKDGKWSDPTTWEQAHLPSSGDSVLIRPHHRVIYDVASDEVVRAVHVGGILTFATDRNTRLCVGLLRVASGEDCVEEGFDCHSLPRAEANAAFMDRPALEVGTPDTPVGPEYTAVIRLTYVQGMPAESFPALICCGGRMDLHGAPLSRSWMKLGEGAYPGERVVSLIEPVTGWKPGDKLLIPTTEGSPFYTQDKSGRRIIGPVLDDSQTEENEIASISGTLVYLKSPLKFKHQAEGKFRGEVADLSRNVMVESADPNGNRGHTMYHRGSKGSVSYAEFRHLGKEGVLGRYPLHFHLCGDTMRGSSVVGCSIWDSRNRWITLHGTDYMVVQDCVGYRSIGHGYFFEDGTEVYNVMDRNLAVQALMGKPLPEQNLPFDTNDAAGFWWANCKNSFTQNVAAECGKHGYRFQMVRTETFSPELRVRQPDGTQAKVDVRTLPFVRFEGNEARSQRRFALNLGGFHGQSTTEDLDRDGNVIDRVGYLGGDVQGVGPDAQHPFRIKDFLVWRSHWAFHTTAPNVQVNGFTAHDINYVVWRSNIAGHDYNHVDFQNIHVSTFFNNWGAGNSRSDQLRYVDPVDDAPPATVITRVQWVTPDTLLVEGVAMDDSRVGKVTVNGKLAKVSDGPLATWTAILSGAEAGLALDAIATDEAGNQEITGHKVRLDLDATKRPATPSPNLPHPPPEPVASSKAASSSKEAAREAVVNAADFEWPLWDGKESVAEYARRAELPAEKTLQVGAAKQDMKLVLVPAGSYLMGSPESEAGRGDDESPQHRVVIPHPFYMGKVEVTQAQYEAVTGSNPSHFRAGDRPVEQVSWYDATAFLAKSGQALRLPTEAEWEYACRGGTTTAYSTGNDLQSASKAAWYGYEDELGRALSDAESHAVGLKPPNVFGLQDMHGNVYEWCADWYASDTYSSKMTVDPRGPERGDEKVLRGGSWEAPGVLARSANRNGFSPNSKGYVVGFRVVQDAPVRPRHR